MSYNDIPGFIPNPERKTYYLQVFGDEDYSTISQEISTLLGEKIKFGHGPKNGGLLFENVVMKNQSDIRFLCISFRGDLNAWLSIIEQVCQSRLAIYAYIDKYDVVYSDGRRDNVDNCIFSALD